MRDFQFEFKEPNDYQKRSRNSQIINLIISFCIFVIVTLKADWKNGLGITLFFGIVQYFKSSRWDKIFIRQIENRNQILTINYNEKGTEKELKGHINDFNIKKETAFNKTRTVYLAIYYKGALALKQFEIGDWNENKMDDLISANS